MFPQSERVVYKNNTIVSVICQLRYPPILEIDSGVPAIFQNKIRTIYPYYEKSGGEEVLPRDMSQILSQFHLGREGSITHKFLNENKTEFVTLTSEYTAITATKYVSWDEFKKSIEHAKNALEEIYKPAFYSRIGLRYEDVINKNKVGLKDVSWDKLINKALVGLLGADEIRKSVLETRNDTLMKVEEIEGGFLKLRHGLMERKDEVLSYRLDADFFTVSKRRGEDVSKELDGFNRTAGNFFRWAITDELKAALGTKDIDK
jgi:uncharacterized protein (TIGR04255 family)